MRTEDFGIGVLFYGVGIVEFVLGLVCTSYKRVDVVREGSYGYVYGLCVCSSRMPFGSSAYLVGVSVVGL